VRAVLEQRFYSRSRAIKRQVAASKLQALLAAAEQMMAQAGQRLSDYQSLLEAASASLCADRFLFAREFLPAERLRLHQALFDLYREAAREVLDFVRPRRWPFGSHQASSADRDFLLDLIEEQLGQLVGGSLGRLVAEISRILAAVSDSQRAAPAGIEWPLAGRLAGQLAEAAATEQTRAGVSAAWRRSLEEQVYARYLAFARGTLRGGRVDDFFVRRLPQLELSEEAVTRALLRDAVDVDEELVPPLGAFVERLLGEEVERMANQVQAVGAAACDLEQRALTPVRAVVAAITGERPGATTSAIDRDAAPPPQSPRSPPPAAEQR
jgi:hypothetical protein